VIDSFDLSLPCQKRETSLFGVKSSQRDEERSMTKSIGAAVFLSTMLVVGGAAAQGMLLDAAADKVVQKYQTASCEDLKAMKGEVPSEKEKMAVEFLRNDSQARKYFVDKIAAPVLNKMFDCGMIP
jgi:hypothetical protein